MKYKFALILLICCFICSSIPSFADTTSSGSAFIDKLSQPTTVGQEIEKEITDNVGTLYKTIQTIGVIITLIVVVICGVQWLVATPNKKAELKSKMFGIAVGLAMILLAATVVSIVVKVLQTSGLN